MKKFRLSPSAMALFIIAAVSIILNIVAAFILPEELRTQINLTGGSVDPMKKNIYLYFSSGIIAICSVAGLYLRDKRVRYLIVESILAIANIAVFVGNLMI